MAGNNKNINIKIKAQAELGAIDKAKQKINEFGKGNVLKTLNNLNGTVGLVGKTFKVVTQAIGKAADSVKEYIEAANKQMKAETQLEAAAKNNPYLNSENVKQLKDFASQLQSIGTIGDEELLPMMGQLAAAGRTQNEIQDIMSAALDVSASGAMSLESAVKNLNKTYSGLSGELGENIPQIKALTAEQLKSGEAVKVVAAQYKGMAAETTKATGSGIQLKNAVGDLKEQLGMGWASITAPINRLFTSIIVTVGNAIGKVNEFLGFAHEQAEATKKGSELADEYVKTLEKETADIEKQLELKKKQNEQEKPYIDALKEQTRQTRNISAEYERYNELKNKGSEKTKEERAEQRKLREENKAAFEEIEKSQKNQDISQLEQLKTIENYNKSVQEEHALEEKLAALAHDKAEAEKEYKRILQEEQNIDSGPDDFAKEIMAINQKAKAYSAMGKPMSELEIVQEKLNAAEKSYLDLSAKNDSAAQKRLEDVKKYAAALGELNGTDTQKELVLKWSAESKDAKKELEETKKELEDLRAQIKDNQLVLPGIDISAVDTAIANIQTAIDAAGNESVSRFEEIAANIGVVLNSLSSGLGNVDQYFDQYADIQLDAIQKEADKEADSLKTQYENGIISYEEYLEKKDELDKKAAQKEYKIKLAQWQMDMAVATVNAAQATLNALASGTPPANIVNAVTAGLLGAAQVATVAANKPIAPSFATGGFLTGNSTTGDKIAFKGNAGEAILNASEQRQFMRYANGEAEGQGINITMPININNNVANDASVSVARQERTIQITVDRIVNSGFKNGTYTDNMTFAEQSKNGKRYL